MKIVTAKEMQSIDKKAIENYGISGIVLMENAAMGVVSSILKRFPDIKNKRVGIFSGKGNNGGDGLAVARHLNNKGVETTVYLLSKKEMLKGDARTNLNIADNARTNLNIADKMGIRIFEIASLNELEAIKDDALKNDIFIDAIFGTGLTSGVKGYYTNIIKFINSSGKFILSIDIPSGLSSDTGEIIGGHIKADLTVSLCLPKIGEILYPAAEYIGDLDIADIGIPKTIIDEEGIKVNLIENADVAGILPKRRPDTHKGTYGHLIVVAGSKGKGGAAAMASISALRAGAGLVTLALPECLNTSFETRIPEVMTLPLPDTKDGTIDKSASKILLKFLEGKSAVLIGPGITTNPSTSSFVKKIIKEIGCPLLIDADGLNIVADEIEILKKRASPVIVTPHPGEMARMLNTTSKEIQANRIESGRKLAVKYRLYVILKGARTVIAAPDGDVYINPTGNPGMATAGTGDVLSGIIAGFLCQGLSAKDSSILGVYLHGMAGDIAADKLSQTALIAGDLLKYFPEAVKKIEKQRPEFRQDIQD
ncbi:MAG: NAD(P)H-hydrate dehydratase [Nitrospinae bacterium]|nr:NAD(P)H-hydrate dehydratase [Nitrospinota bacterium]